MRGYYLIPAMLPLLACAGRIGSPPPAGLPRVQRATSEAKLQLSPAPAVVHAIAQTVETSPCARDLRRTVRHSLCLDEEADTPEEDCTSELLLVTLTFCDSSLRQVGMSGYGFGANGSRELYFDDQGHLLLVADEAHGSLWRSESFSYASEGGVCTLAGADEWDEEATDKPDPPLKERLVSRGACDLKVAWPLLPYDEWETPSFESIRNHFESNSVLDDISLVRYLLRLAP